MSPQEQYDQYLKLHRDFSQSYAVVYKQVMDFYPLPQKFIQEATPEIDLQIEKFWECRNNPTEEESFRSFVHFAQNFREFAGTANNIFEEYKGLRGESGDYIKTVFRLKQKNPTGNCAEEYVELIPVLNRLMNGFKQVKQKTEEAAKNLYKLQNEWGSLRQKINQPKGFIRP
jgi:hypothetical protein